MWILSPNGVRLRRGYCGVYECRVLRTVPLVSALASPFIGQGVAQGYIM